VTLSQALHILAETHTRDDDEIGFTVQAYVGNDFLTYRYSREEYIEAGILYFPNPKIANRYKGGVRC